MAGGADVCLGGELPETRGPLRAVGLDVWSVLHPRLHHHLLKGAFEMTSRVSHRLFLISYMIPFLGIFIKPGIVWPVTFSLAVAWILLGRYEREGALAMMWGVQVEPAPCDILFAYTGFKRLAADNLNWPSFVELHMLLFFVLLNILQLSWVSDLEKGIWFAGATAYTISLGFLFAGGPKTLRELKIVQYYYLIAVIITGGILLLLTILDLVGVGDNLAQLYYAGRPKGFFKDPNVAGPFVVTGILFTLSQLIFRRVRPVGKNVFLVLLLFIAVITTFSRGALLNLAGGIIMLGLLALWRRKGSRFMIINVLLIITAVLVVPWVLGAFGQAQRFLGLTEYDVYGRFTVWQAGFRIVSDNPWGIGPGQFEVISPAYQTRLSVKKYVLTPAAHNTYLRVLAENGIAGFTLLIGALLGFLWKSLKTCLVVKGEETVAATAWLCSSLVGILAESFVIDTLHWRHFWILVGLSLAYRSLHLKFLKKGEVK